MPLIPADFRKAGAKILMFDHVLHRLPIGMALLSLDGIYEAANDAYCAIYGHKQKELLGRRCSLSFQEQPLLQVRALSPDSAHRGAMQHGEQQVLRFDGSLSYISFKLVSVWGADGIHRHLVYATDITHLKPAQEKLRQAVAKSQALLKKHSRRHLRDPAGRNISVQRSGFGVSRGAMAHAADSQRSVGLKGVTPKPKAASERMPIRPRHTEQGSCQSMNNPLLPSPLAKRQPPSRKTKVASQPHRSSKYPDRSQHIAIAAYFKAQARGFSPSRELDDWLQAEVEVDQQTAE